MKLKDTVERSYHCGLLECLVTRVLEAGCKFSSARPGAL